jgi:hypothetical protein
MDAMRTRHPNMESIEVADQGHVPSLSGSDLIERIAAFVDRCDAAATMTDAPR